MHYMLYIKGSFKKYPNNFKMKSITFVLLVTFFVHPICSQNETHFICIDGNSINVKKLCDGLKDCPDGSDERKSICHPIVCPLDNFHCYYGACISKKLECDGKWDCADGSDEVKCGRKPGSCNENEFRCSSGECIPLNQLCNGKNDCKNNSDEGDICDQISLCPNHTHRCRVGGCIYLEQRCDGHKDCIDGSDESESFCKNKTRHCPPITPTRINARCEVPEGPHKGIVPCNAPLPPGTIVQYECKPYFIPASAHVNNKQMICQPDGTWNRDCLRCIPDCGIAEPDVEPLIVNGWISEKGKFPWHTVLFALEEGNWTFICGGTLITEKTVITGLVSFSILHTEAERIPFLSSELVLETKEWYFCRAAHCTWKMKPHLLQVGLGKHYSSYYKTEDYAQIRNISKIIQQPLYQDFLGNYGSDIAILVLSEPVEFSAIIRPACIDWNLDDISDHLMENKMGLIVGMGITENDTFSETLRAAYLPVIDDNNCMKKQKKDFRKYITFTSFCAGWRNGTSVCNGDSGGGLVFPSEKNPNKFTLQGIVSVSPRRPGTSFCDTKFYTVLTKVGIYVEWIYKVLQEIHNDDKYVSVVNNDIIM